MPASANRPPTHRHGQGDADRQSDASPGSFQLQYLPELDGLRAIAVGLVFAFHVVGPFYYLPNGWLGVDVFFVLSGFLITSLLVAEANQNGRVDLGKFYIRRGLRLVPALALLLAMTNLANLVIGDFSASMVAQDSLAAGLYVSNWVYAFDGLPRMYLQHTWSLAVEEQYYLLWAAAVAAALARRFKPITLARTALAIAIASLAWRSVLLWPLGQSYERAYFGFDARLDGLLIGSALGAYVHTTTFTRMADRLRQRSSTWFLAVALALLAVLARFGFNSGSVDLVVIVTVVNVATALIIVAVLATPDNRVKHLLSNPALVAIGRMSYGVYLYHILAINLVRHYLNPPAELLSAGALVLTLIVAAASYRLVEAPALRLKDRFASGLQPTGHSR